MAAVPALGGWKECWHAPRGEGAGGGCHQCPHCPRAFCFYCNDMLEEREEKKKKKTQVGEGRGGQKRKREQGPWCGLMSRPGRMCRQLGGWVEGARPGRLGGQRCEWPSSPPPQPLLPGTGAPPGAAVELCQSGADARVWGLHPEVPVLGWALSLSGCPRSAKWEWWRSWVVVTFWKKCHVLPSPGSVLLRLGQSEDSQWDRMPSTAPERQAECQLGKVASSPFSAWSGQRGER